MCIHRFSVIVFAQVILAQTSLGILLKSHQLSFIHDVKHGIDMAAGPLPTLRLAGPLASDGHEAGTGRWGPVGDMASLCLVWANSNLQWCHRCIHSVSTETHFVTIPAVTHACAHTKGLHEACSESFLSLCGILLDCIIAREKKRKLCWAPGTVRSQDTEEK